MGPPLTPWDSETVVRPLKCCRVLTRRPFTPKSMCWNTEADTNNALLSSPALILLFIFLPPLDQTSGLDLSLPHQVIDDIFCPPSDKMAGPTKAGPPFFMFGPISPFPCEVKNALRTLSQHIDPQTMMTMSLFLPLPPFDVHPNYRFPHSLPSRLHTARIRFSLQIEVLPLLLSVWF